jgi:DNA-binding transcriptional ArsR family regulator
MKKSPYTAWYTRPPDPSTNRAAETLRLLTNINSAAVIAALENVESATVLEIEHVVGNKQPTVSANLRKLRQAGLVELKKSGKYVHYFLNRDRLAKLREVCELIEKSFTS